MSWWPIRGGLSMRGILNTFARVCRFRAGFARKASAKVVVIVDGANLDDGQMTAPVARGDHLRVDRADRRRYFVRSTGNLGWIARRDVIEFGRAVDFFTAA